jgi:hypothetical protein
MIGDKTYSYHLLLSTTGGTVHDSDMRDIVVPCHPHSDFSRNRSIRRVATFRIGRSNWTSPQNKRSQRAIGIIQLMVPLQRVGGLQK